MSSLERSVFCNLPTPRPELLSSVAAVAASAGAASTMSQCFGLCFDFSVNIVSNSLYQPNSAHYIFSMRRAIMSRVSWLDCGWHRPISHSPHVAFSGSFPEASPRQCSVLLFCPHDHEARAIAFVGFGKDVMDPRNESQSLNKRPYFPYSQGWVAAHVSKGTHSRLTALPCMSCSVIFHTTSLSHGPWKGNGEIIHLICLLQAGLNLNICIV